jgi:[acyl-carrier-protein] S-malonyltransferase
MNVAFVFSGQGAQTVGMGKSLNEGSKAAAEIFAEADKVLGWSISEICFEGPEEKLTESRFCQPAIYTMSVACLAAFQEKFPELKPVGCAGLSLGEFAALKAAGVFSFADGLKLVAKRGELMDEACQETEGGMASVLGGDLDIIKEVCKDCDIDVANYNCPGQIVISGQKELVVKAVEDLKARGLRKVIPLKVAGAYHSRLMAEAGTRLQAVLDGVPMSDPVLPVYQNFTGGKVDNIKDIRQNLVSQVAGSVRWEECVKALIAAGADTFIEFGPGNVLTGLVKRTDREQKLFNIGTMDDIGNFSE